MVWVYRRTRTEMNQDREPEPRFNAPGGGRGGYAGGAMGYGGGGGGGGGGYGGGAMGGNDRQLYISNVGLTPEQPGLAARLTFPSSFPIRSDGKTSRTCSDKQVRLPISDSTTYKEDTNTDERRSSPHWWCHPCRCAPRT